MATLLHDVGEAGVVAADAERHQGGVLEDGVLVE
jgi:hypothetical protein